MPSAAGIIVATGTMTLANEFLQAQNPDPNAPVASRVNFRIIPATAIAAGIFYVFEQAAPTIAKGVAWIAFMVAFAFPAAPTLEQEQHPETVPLSPLGTLIRVTQGGIPFSNPMYTGPLGGFTNPFSRLPYNQVKGQ